MGTRLRGGVPDGNCFSSGSSWVNLARYSEPRLTHERAGLCAAASAALARVLWRARRWLEGCGGRGLTLLGADATTWHE